MKKLLIFLILFLHTLASTAYSQDLPKTGKLISYTEIGALVGNKSNEEDAPFIFHSSLNYVLNRNLSAGLGAGLEFLSETYMPVTANLLYRFKDKKDIEPFVRISAGYQVPLENRQYVYRNGYRYEPYYSYWPYPTPENLDSQGGLLINPSVGITYYLKAGFGISLAVGYRYQKLNYKGSDSYKLHVEYNRLSLSLGFIF